MRKEPAITVGTIVALVTAGLAVATAFGLHLTSDQQKAILGLAAVAAPIVSGLITRKHVTPVGRHRA